LILIAHVGPFPVEELLPAGVIALAVGIPFVRAKAKARLTRRASRREGSRLPG
jgi:adenine/guanine phosphoribosyltransferase-like PRPP-binding protein